MPLATGADRSTWVRRLKLSPHARLIGALFVLAFAVRLAAQIATGAYDHPKVFEYDAIARGLVRGEGYHYTFLGTDWLTFGFPAFPFILAGLHWIGGGPQSYGLVLIGIAAISAALSPLGFLLARDLLDTRAGVLAGLVLAVDPTLLVYAVQVHELSFDAAIFVVLLLATFRAVRGSDARPLGVVSGLTALARPTAAAFALLTILALAAVRRRRAIGVSALIAVAIAAPWTIRNALVLGAPNASTPYACVTTWMGNNDAATGGAIDAEGRSVFDDMRPELAARVVGRPETEQGRAFCDDAARFLTASIPRELGWWATKFFYFWWFPPHAGLLYPAGLIDLYRPAYAVEVVFGLAGLVAIWRTGWRVGLLVTLSLLLLVSISQSFGYVEGRHRIALEPVLVALASCGGSFALRLRERRRRSSGARALDSGSGDGDHVTKRVNDTSNALV